MEKNHRDSITQRAKTALLGDPRNPQDPRIFHKLSLIAFFAWVGLGADGLSSSCYGPEEAFLALKGHTYLALLVALGTVITIFIIATCYQQIIELFPTGGGGYLVATKLLSPTFGMISGCALLIDYVLPIALSIASGADAIFSFLPQSVYPFKLTFAIFGLGILIVLNLRGVRESIVPLIPIFLVFLVTHVFAIGYTVFTHTANFSQVLQTTVTEIHASQTELGFFGMILLIMRAYSMGAGTYTGIEAVSNGLPILREPKVATARHTMRYMSISLAFMVLGIMLGYVFFGVSHVPGKTLNAVLFEKMVTNWPKGLGYSFVFITLFSEAILLFVASQTGFLGGPRVLVNMALDRWFPTRFASLSDRLVTQNGILLMGGAAILLMFLAKGSVKFLVVLYAINVFITFFLSQIGMVKHWWQNRMHKGKWFFKLLIAGLGMVLTGFILLSVSIIKFNEGGWITLTVTSTLIAIALIIRRHYNRIGLLLKRLDSLVEAAMLSITEITNEGRTRKRIPGKADPKGRTVVILTNGFNGLGLHTLFGTIKLFGGDIKNFVFVRVGMVDAGVFKGTEELALLQKEVDAELDRYIFFMKQQGFYAEGISAIGIDIVEEIAKLAPQILQRYPQAIFFGGQLVFPNEPMFSRWLHNYTVFAIQRRFYYQGIPVMMLPIRV